MKVKFEYVEKINDISIPRVVEFEGTLKEWEVLSKKQYLIINGKEF